MSYRVSEVLIIPQRVPKDPSQLRYILREEPHPKTSEGNQNLQTPDLRRPSMSKKAPKPKSGIRSWKAPQHSERAPNLQESTPLVKGLEPGSGQPRSVRKNWLLGCQHSSISHIAGQAPLCPLDSGPRALCQVEAKRKEGIDQFKMADSSHSTMEVQCPQETDEAQSTVVFRADLPWLRLSSSWSRGSPEQVTKYKQTAIRKAKAQYSQETTGHSPEEG